MEFLRDVRHLAGRPAAPSVPPPPTPGLAVHRRWDPEGAPVLVVARADGTLARLPFRDRVRLLVADGTHCVGQVAGDRHVPCPAGRPADRFEQCAACHPLPDRDCVFDPRCTDCTLEFCTGPHEVYVAFYGARAKVGMTRAARGGDRLVEQGADAYTRVAGAAGRKAARDIEDRVTRLVGTPQSVPARRYLPERAREPPWDGIEGAYARLAPLLAEATGTAPGPLVHLAPGRGLPLSEAPVPVAVVSHHDGLVAGGKGRHLFYRASADGVLRALDLDGVVTHAVRFDEADTSA